MTSDNAVGMSARDPLDGEWDPTAYWSTSNVGEAMPGVLTPLCWSIWGPAAELSLRYAFFRLGALERSRTTMPTSDTDRVMGIFHGRVAVRVDMLGEVGDRLPGTDGKVVVQQCLGWVPDGFRSQHTRRRYAVIAVRFPTAMATMRRRLRRLAREIDPWWRSEITNTPTLDLDAALAQWRRAVKHFDHAVFLQAESVFVAVQPAYDQLVRAAERAGRPDLAAVLLSGQGSHAETAMVEDIWRLSRDEITLTEFLAEHGYHGPGEGELSSRVWREDPAPIRSLITQYKNRPDADRPSIGHHQRAARRAAAERELLDALSGTRRLHAQLALRLADRIIPLRGVGKVAFLQSFDVARAAARRIGEHLVLRGALDQPDDVFMLLADELAGAASNGRLRDLVAQRREVVKRHRQVTLPGAWQGRPPVSTPADDAVDPSGEPIKAIGASPGVVEGRVRVIDDPVDAHVEDGEILVTRTTDPSWASIMFVSAALVVDIGNLLSHAAVVARELGIPCVMGTGDGTQRLGTGDLVRVDGHAGTVEVIRRASA